VIATTGATFTFGSAGFCASLGFDDTNFTGSLGLMSVLIGFTFGSAGFCVSLGFGDTNFTGSFGLLSILRDLILGVTLG